MRTHHAAAPGPETDESGGVVWQAPFSSCRARLAAAAERLHERSALAVVPPKASDAPVLALYRVKVIAETLAAAGVPGAPRLRESLEWVTECCREAAPFAATPGVLGAIADRFDESVAAAIAWHPSSEACFFRDPSGHWVLRARQPLEAYAGAIAELSERLPLGLTNAGVASVGSGFADVVFALRLAAEQLAAAGVPGSHRLFELCEWSGRHPCDASTPSRASPRALPVEPPTPLGAALAGRFGEAVPTVRGSPSARRGGGRRVDAGRQLGPSAEGLRSPSCLEGGLGLELSRDDGQ
eukprot:gene17403-26739_t